ncbi:ABC transporter permease [Flavivirga spongiicola]|uniref:ABC transporter permease n=1 Tax=Flavivirga spongiicola TaxID=421621 RepID=A0ABU7XYB9_9FLAO|nr:FtsX-like permease family protein [Flavivirga sp. MEBiC05379]MDO5980774.1 ABC transporter permease [Flavivirga sp. MEBiC05379]
MVRNYFKIAFRNLRKDKVFSLINIIGLSIGLSASFVIGLIIFYDLTFDKFHPDNDRIYRITSNFTTPEGEFYNSGTPIPLGESLKNTTPEVEIASPFFTLSPENVRNSELNKVYTNLEKVIYTDNNYFQLFHYQWLAGVSENVLTNPNEVVLSENRAQKYFPSVPLEQIIGKTLIYNDSIAVNVIGIVANFKKRSDLLFEEFISVKTVTTQDMGVIDVDASWNTTNSASQLFIKTNKNTHISYVKQQLNILAKEHEDKQLVAFGMERKFHLQPLKDLHFNLDYGIFNDSPSPASKATLWGLSYIAMLLLLLGCINFINLSTAQATKRAKEIGVRKTLGSSKNQLVFQFLIETLLLTTASSILSILFSIGLLRVFSDFISQSVNFELFANFEILISIIILLLIITLLSGFYPAFVISKFKPVLILKNQITSGKDKFSLRKYLVVFQLLIAQVFIIATILIGKQLHFLINKDMGFKTDATAFIRTWRNPSADKRSRFIEAIKTVPQIKSVSLGGNPPASNSTISNMVTYHTNQGEIHTSLQFLYGDQDYRNVYNIELLAGRERLNDSVQEFIINEACSKALGFNNPQEAIGKILKMDNLRIPIVGVMKDFNQRSLKTNIEPMALIGDWHRSQFNTIHFSLDRQASMQWSKIIKQMKNTWKTIYPEAVFEVNFMDSTIKQFYEQEHKTATLSKWATGLAILISCMGLLGLVTHTIERRTKEIGIRKILGASLTRLNFLLYKEFLVLVLIAFSIAVPIAWWALNRWLEDFAYRTALSWWIFILCGLAMLCIALIIMSIKTIVLVRTNPVDTLRIE